MSAKHNAREIVVHKVQFEFPEDFNPHWNAAQPELSQIFNSVSLHGAPHWSASMPSSEPVRSSSNSPVPPVWKRWRWPARTWS